MSLGSVFEADARPPGRDLHARVAVGRDQLGGRVKVTVPLQLDLDGEMVTRAVGPGETGSEITLNLPTTQPELARLRMRGLGEIGPSGRAGDLYLTVQVVDRPARPTPGLLLGAVLLALVLAAWMWAR